MGFDFNVPEVVRDLCVNPEAKIYDALRVPESTHREIVLVVDRNGKLQGTVTDGDIRRGTLRGLGSEAGVAAIMNEAPTVGGPEMSAGGIMQLMKRQRILQLPVVDDDGRVVELMLFSEMMQDDLPASKAVVMAGGKGSRLRPLTRDIPKPLLPVGGKPILETIVEQLVDCGMSDVYLVTHYKADMIEEHFSRLSYPGCNLHFVYEPEPMGTAGGLALVRDDLGDPFLVMNADIISRMSFKDMLQQHIDTGASMSVASKVQDLEIPYGVIETGEGGRIEGFAEKPIMHFTFNIGVYALSPSALELIPENEVTDMSALIQDLLDRGETVVEYAVKDYWIDIGRMADYERACEDILTNRL
jgi:dTDP-glucose pyrophosphorylase/predicted transcriptional regulator